METLLHYVWKHRLYDASMLITNDGLNIEIIDPGLHNTNAGPDFFNAKIRIDKRIWAGNVEIHTCSSDWYKHSHEKDGAYDSVILHVTGQLDRDQIFSKSGRSIPQLMLKIPEHIRQNYLYLVSKELPVPCLNSLAGIPEIYLTDWKNALLTERLEQKTQHLFQLLEEYKGNWNEVFYITLSRNFGFGINNDAFERLAKSLPLQYIQKQQESQLQVDALFLGQAGLLEEEDLTDHSYFLSLQKEYRFLRKKYRLQPLESYIFKSLRVRPHNFPHIKIVQLAGLIRIHQHLFSRILELDNIHDLLPLFISNLDEYWMNHYHFTKSSTMKPKNLGLSAIHILLINTVVPVLFAYGKQKNQDSFSERALRFLEIIPPEKNSIVNTFTRTGIQACHAGDSQALIQLKRVYCEQKKCIFCRIGHKLLSKERISG